MPLPDAQHWIDRLHLTPHVEGGAYKEVYRSPLVLPKEILPSGFSGDCAACTHIYFLLHTNTFSAFHKIRSDECWHFYAGNTLLIYEIEPDGTLLTHRLGNDMDKGDTFFTVIKAGNWFASVPAPGSSYALVGCSVSPGFVFDDFELADRAMLTNAYPQHAALITTLTRI
jgi:uncharacterized protein